MSVALEIIDKKLAELNEDVAVVRRMNERREGSRELAARLAPRMRTIVMLEALRAEIVAAETEQAAQRESYAMLCPECHSYEAHGYVSRTNRCDKCGYQWNGNGLPPPPSWVARACADAGVDAVLPVGTFGPLIENMTTAQAEAERQRAKELLEREAFGGLTLTEVNAEYERTHKSKLDKLPFGERQSVIEDDNPGAEHESDPLY